jgi:hypothetical protein
MPLLIIIILFILHNTSFGQAAKKSAGILSVAYVEVNNNNLLNAGAYTLKSTGKPLFNFAIIFAANINYDSATKKVVLYNNPNVDNVLKNAKTYIEPLQKKGIKVLLTVLGNHAGVGISNFTNYASAKEFAIQLSNTVSLYNLDGIDFDDEYADYKTPANDSSFTMLLCALRALMPAKIISFYYYGPATSSLTWEIKKAGDFLNYSWNAAYGTFSAPVVPGMPKSNFSPAAVWINNTNVATAKSFAKKTIAGDYGAFMCYDISNVDEHQYMSSFSTVLYGDSTELTGGLKSRVNK